MKPLLPFLLLCLTAHGAQQPPSAWQWFSWNGAKYSAHNTASQSFAFPQNSYFPTASFITTTSDASVLGDLTGQTLTANFTVTASPDCVFWFGGQGRWNMGTTPANVRFYFSTSTATYSLKAAQQNPDAYWFCISYTVISPDTFYASMPLTPGSWSNAQGQLASDRQAQFNAAVANVHQVGLSFGGGNFADVGCSVDPGSATFQLNTLTTQ